MPLRLIPHLHKATHQIALHLAADKQLRVSQAEAHVLSFLDERRGKASVADLHQSFGHKRSTLTSILDRLEERGLVERTLNPDDRRSLNLELTAEGARLAAAAHKVLARLEERVLRRLKKGQLEAIVAALDALAEAATG